MECERSGWLNSKAALIIEWKEGFGGGQIFIGFGMTKKIIGGLAKMRDSSLKVWGVFKGFISQASHLSTIIASTSASFQDKEEMKMNEWIRNQSAPFCRLSFFFWSGMCAHALVV